ncbi:MAG: sensor domain-containing diguanylate cyclase [Campylobacterales bacterium]|nr:sensor domain-containing diguanylate cyclase [Campylobacterales bacterium]
MIYDFSALFKEKDDALLETFCDLHSPAATLSTEEELEEVGIVYKKIFALFAKPFELKEMKDLFEALALLKIRGEVPYVLASNKMYSFESVLISQLSKNSKMQEIISVIELFKILNNAVAKVYLLEYTEKLISLNNLRRSSLVDLVEKHLIKHYESHLVWLSSLAKHIQEQNATQFPELDDTRCEFGSWLHSEAKLLIKNNSKYKAIDKLHHNLHLFAHKIYKILNLDEYHTLITYLEKCELISLSIGTELALLDQIEINKKVAKDSLTGALNRNALEGVFEGQYEIAFATNNTFVVAMCDLDYFKDINDTYGHIAGDQVLKKFVDIVKKNIRSSDLIIRYGGEEFVIILSAITEAKGYEVLNKIREMFSQCRVKYDGREIKCSVSIGMSEINPQKSFKKNMINKYLMEVDQELYIAKANGRNRVMC